MNGIVLDALALGMGQKKMDGTAQWQELCTIMIIIKEVDKRETTNKMKREKRRKKTKRKGSKECAT